MSSDHMSRPSRITDTLLPAAPPAPAHRPGSPAPVPPPRPSGPTPPPAPAAPPQAAPAGPPGPMPPAAPAAPAVPAVETTTRLRPVRDASPAPRPHPSPYPYGNEAPAETTTRLRPVRERRTGRTLASAACLVLGVGLIGGALAGVWLAASEAEKAPEPPGPPHAAELWHNAPVDTLFPRTLTGPGAGPGSAARTWTRVVVAPDAPCGPASLAPRLLARLTPLGCERVLRATYTDATASSVTTVGLVFTRADATAQRALDDGGLTARLGRDLPPALPGPGTVAAGFGPAQRASWWLEAPGDLPVVVTAVSGFADGRRADRPLPADQAVRPGRTDAVSQAGLGHEARGLARRLTQQLRETALLTADRSERGEDR